MKKIYAEIKGIAPILFNRFFDTSVLNGPRGQKDSEKEAAAKLLMMVYRNTVALKDYQKEKGAIGLPGINVSKCMLYGAWSSGMKIKTKGISAYFRATVFIEESFISFEVKKPDGIHETTVKVGPQKIRKILHRPYLNPGWMLKFHILLTDERITPGMTKTALQEAGIISGLGDHRPEFGRFEVVKFEELVQK